MKSFFTEIPEAFRVGLIYAPPGWRRTVAQVAVGVLVAFALASLTAAVLFFIWVGPLAGITMTLNSFTFAMVAIQVIYQSAADEYRRMADEQWRRIDELLGL